ncbi:MAG TPA: bifunctional nuclease family protein [Nitrospiria bacterium]
MEIKFKVSGVLSDKAEEQIVVLKDEKNQETFTFWVGPAEGDAIRFVLDRVNPSRPMSHDLLGNLLDQFSIKVSKVVIHDMKNATYFARIYLTNKVGGELVIDSRPSDAIALALRTHSPIFVDSEVLKKGNRDSIDGLLEKYNVNKLEG